MITMQRYAAGEIIFSENDVGETAYIIERGRVEVLKMLDGKNVHLAYLGAGEPFGEMGMIDEKPRSATVVAVEETVVRKLHRDDFFQNLQAHPEIAINLLKVIFERLREADATILHLYRSHPELAPVQSAPLHAAPPLWNRRLPGRVNPTGQQSLTRDAVADHGISLPDR